MTKTMTYPTATLLIAMLLAAPVAFADSDRGKVKADVGAEAGLHLRLGKFLGFGEGPRESEKADEHADVRARFHRDDESTSTRAELRARILNALTHVTAGIVTSVDGPIFTIDTFGPKATTTIVTDAQTIFKARGEATTSGAITVGSKIFAIGTTTATSSEGDTFTASVVKLIGNGFKHLRLWLHLGL